MKKYIRILSISMVVSLSIFGCAAREKLDTYPQRHIDRPYTLPKGINSWTTNIHYAHYKDQYDDGDSQFFANPLIWNQPITDNLNLIWSPLPLSLQYQLIHTEKCTVGVFGAMGIGYSSTEGLLLNPFISAYYKIKLSDSIAIENRLAVENEFGDADDDAWEVDFQSGPLFQIRDNLAISPRLHLAIDNIDGPDYSFDRDDKFEQKETQYALPISLWIGWSLNKQFDLNFEYTYKELGYSNDFEGHEFTASIVHRW